MACAEGKSFSVAGIVADSSSKAPVELATVALKATNSETIIDAATADAEGKFNFTLVKPGKYDLVVAFMGYNTKKIGLIVSADVNLGKILIAPQASTLKAAVITAQRSEITVSADKTVFNVAQSPTSQVGTADDLLRNIPGVTVDQDGNVSIIGKQGVKVLVDGKPNAQADNDLPGFLKSLPANSVESIEVINNPSARYDAEGNAGIINIKLKKGKGDGLNVSLSAGYGILNRYNGNVNINYKKNKFNIFVNYSANDSKTGFTSISDRTITVNDTTTHYNYTGTGTQKRFSNNAKAGFDYTIDDKTSFTYTASGNYSHSNSITNATALNLNAGDVTTNTFNSGNQSLGLNYSVNNNFALTKKFDSTDRELDINLNHSYVGSGNDVSLNSMAYDSSGMFQPANSVFQKTTNPTSLQNIMVKLDYTHPLKKLKRHKIEAGLKNETTINKNQFNDYNVVNNVQQYDTLLSNRFKYTENVAAAYGIFSGGYKTWFTYSGGLRIENTFITSDYSGLNKNYIDFFPSANAGFALNDTQNFSISYSRRIQRPPFRFINNAITYTDQFTTWQGNPNLQPSYSNSVNVAYSNSILKHMFVLKAGGNFVSNGFTGVNTVDSNRIARGTEINGVNSQSCNVSAYVKLHLTNWWEAQVYYNFSYTHYDFTPGLNLSALAGGTNNLWGSLRFKFWTNAAFEVSGWYNTRSINPQGANLPVGALYASLKKSFLKDQLTVSFAANDIVNSMKWRWTTEDTGILSTGSWQGTNRYLMITLSYRFGTHDLEERKLREENERIGEGKS